MWDKMEMSAGSWEYSGPAARHMWVEGAKSSMRAVAVGGGYATDAEIDEIAAAWEEWGTHDEARLLGLDGQILCSK